MSSRLRALKSVKKNIYAPQAGIGGLTILTPLKSLLGGDGTAREWDSNNSRKK